MGSFMQKAKDLEKEHATKKAQQDEIYKMFARVFSTQDGEKVLNYLGNLTIYNALDGGMRAEAYTYHMGMNRIFNIIQHHVNEGKK